MQLSVFPTNLGARVRSGKLIIHPRQPLFVFFPFSIPFPDVSREELAAIRCAAKASEREWDYSRERKGGSDVLSSDDYATTNETKTNTVPSPSEYRRDRIVVPLLRMKSANSHVNPRDLWDSTWIIVRLSSSVNLTVTQRDKYKCRRVRTHSGVLILIFFHGESI